MQNLLPVAEFLGDGLVVPVAEDLLAAAFGIDPGNPERRPKFAQRDRHHEDISVTGTIVPALELAGLDVLAPGLLVPSLSWGSRCPGLVSALPVTEMRPSLP